MSYNLDRSTVAKICGLGMASPAHWYMGLLAVDGPGPTLPRGPTQPMKYRPPMMLDGVSGFSARRWPRSGRAAPAAGPLTPSHETNRPASTFSSHTRGDNYVLRIAYWGHVYFLTYPAGTRLQWSRNVLPREYIARSFVPSWDGCIYGDHITALSHWPPPHHTGSSYRTIKAPYN